MRTRWLSSLFAAVLAWLGGAVARAEPSKVTVSIPPLQTIAERVGGSAVAVRSLMGENDDPHSFTPSPRAVAAVADSKVFFTMGLDFEARIATKLGHMFPELEIVDVSQGLRDEDDGGDSHAHHHGHDHGGDDGTLHDPHLWLSLPNLIQISQTMSLAMQKHFPADRAGFAARQADYASELRRRHAEFQEILAPSRGQTFYVYHPAFGYFAEDYGLKQKAVEMDGKAPSPRQLSTLISQARQDHVNVIFVQPQFQQRAADILARRIGGKTVSVNPMNPDPVDLLQKAVEALRESGPDH